MTFPYTHITTLYSSAGMAWLLFGLLICAVGTYITYPPYWQDCLSAVFSKIMRRYTDTSQWLPIIFSHVFLIGTLSLTFSICLHPAEMSFGSLMAGMVVIVSLWLFLRLMVARRVGYIFSIEHEAQAIQEDSVSLMMVGSLLLYLICCGALLFPDLSVTPVLAFVVACLYMVAMSLKVLLSFARSMKSLFYVALYVLTFEIIPLGIVYRTSVRLAQLIQ